MQYKLCCGNTSANLLTENKQLLFSWEFENVLDASCTTVKKRIPQHHQPALGSVGELAKTEVTKPLLP
jgi:hypothetical protein